MKVDKFGNISMTRGDSEFIDVVVIDKPTNNLIPLEQGDTVYFSVKKKIEEYDYVLQKKIEKFEDGIAKIQIFPNDTKYLEFGRYWYDVQLTDKDGIVSTIVKPSIFEVSAEVTYE